MSAMNKTTLLYIRKALELDDACPGFLGAVLASPEGLVLASSGRFDADESAACASGLVVQTANSLGQLAAQGPAEMLVWAADGSAWSVMVLPGDYLLMVATSDASRPDRLRGLVRETAERLGQALRILI